MSDGAGAFIEVEVAFGTPDKQYLVRVELPRDATAADAISAARAGENLPVEVDGLPVGIWGRAVSVDTALSDGDRVEIYRPLLLDPREARRRYAAAGMTMAQHAALEDD